MKIGILRSTDRNCFFFLLSTAFIGIGQSVDGATLTNYLKEYLGMVILQRSLALPGVILKGMRDSGGMPGSSSILTMWEEAQKAQCRAILCASKTVSAPQLLQRKDLVLLPQSMALSVFSSAKSCSIILSTLESIASVPPQYGQARAWFSGLKCILLPQEGQEKTAEFLTSS